VLALANMQMPEARQEDLSDLLYDQGEGLLTEAGRLRLDELMEIYQDNMVRKAQALQVAVQLGLIPPLG
jgi:hypothetical protein